MEDENGLELSLGLSFGGSSSKLNVKDAPSDPKGEETSSSRLVGNNVTISDDLFKKVFKSGLETQEPTGKLKSDFITQPQENFFTDLAKSSTPVTDCSNDTRNNLAQFTSYQEQLISSNKTFETEEEKSGSSKRKLPFEDIKFQNKQEILFDYAEKQDANKSSIAPFLRNSHVSNTAEDGSTGENEIVAESEAEGPQTWLVSQRDENAKCSDTLKFNVKSILSESGGIGSQGLREPCLSGKESNPEYGKPTSGIPLSRQPLKFTNVPYPVPTVAPSTSTGSNAVRFPSACVMQLMPISNGERPVAPTANTNSMQVSFGYPSAQLPTLETGSSWAFNYQPLHISSFTSREQSTGVQIQEHFENGAKASQGAPPHHIVAFPYNAKPSDLLIGSTKHAGETGTSVRSEDQGKPRTNTVPANEAMKKPATEGFPLEAPAIIRPGIAPNLRFGGCGSYPDLPWVTTTGQGPNGRTISGVTYKYNQNQLKIVCACHGFHMSPEEFVQHASSEVQNSENNPNLTEFPTTNTTKSAQS
ncbi:protein NINJA homolog 1 [Dendrobium catenatum]|uniref:protein NINJA homolog 1 n=1 Tax=Dendrobium catenatum TaxID=906689 RepID=UPI0009F4E6B5|nr:protein NINJA homolog 1 [Dendrobium catenatum]XP_020688867.1 protein NINJA homolog 1 [Dendrobium catenatum]